MSMPHAQPLGFVVTKDQADQPTAPVCGTAEGPSTSLESGVDQVEIQGSPPIQVALRDPLHKGASGVSCPG